MNNLLSLVILSISLAVHHSLPTITHFGLKCGFSQSKIKCENVAVTGHEVECEAVNNISGLSSLSANLLGIGTLPKEYDPKLVGTTPISVFLYPRALDDLVYLDHTIQLNGKSVDLTLYHGLTNTGSGIRVTDAVCYAKLLGLINQVQKTGVKNVKLQASLIGDAHELTLVGEVAVENQILHKRQYGYGGWGGYGGYGGWGRYGGWGYGGWGGYRGGYGGWGYYGKK